MSSLGSASWRTLSSVVGFRDRRNKRARGRTRGPFRRSLRLERSLFRLGVVNLHRFLFPAAVVLVPLEGHVAFIGELRDRANLGFHSRHHFFFAGAGYGLSRWIVVAFHRHDSSPHAIHPSGNELFLHVVVGFEAHAFKRDVFHFAVRARPFHHAGIITDHKPAVHDHFSGGGAF